MAALSAQQIDHGTLDRLTQQRDALTRHLADLEAQVVETGQHLAAISETLFRLRAKKQNKTNKMVAKTEYYS